jgi:sialidase-1
MAAALAILQFVVCPTCDINPRNSEGSIAILRDGSLLLAYSEFYAQNISDHAASRISGKVSRDLGATWSEPVVLHENDGKLNAMSASLLRLESGDLLLGWIRKNALNDCQPYFKTSPDDGKTWSEQKRISSRQAYYCVNNDRVAQLKAGRILVPASQTDDVERNYHFTSGCFYSDDRGRTWEESNWVDCAGSGADEPAVIELKDGRVMMLLRTSLGHPYVTVSPDGGKTWPAPKAMALDAPASPQTIKRIPGTGDLLLIWNNAKDRRVPLTAAISRDEGLTWEHVRDIETKPCDRPKAPWDGYAYVSLVFAHDMALLTYYVAGPGERWSLKFTRLPVGWFYGR